MRESLGIVYNGVNLLAENGVQIYDESGLFSETFVASKKIIEEKIRGRDEPYFFGVERDPISFRLSFWFDENLSEERKRYFARILDQDYYCPLYTIDNPNRIYYAMCVDDSQHIHNGVQMGYVTLNFRTNSPYAYSPVYVEEYDLSNNTANGAEIVFTNNGDVECKPIVEIKMVENGNFSIINTTNRGEEFKFVNLQKDELVIVDCTSEEIESNVKPRFDDFNDNYLSLVHGNNYLKVYGKCILTFRYQFKFK